MASNLSWASQAKKLLDEHILQEKLEYKGIYNWTNDLPFGHKKYFLEVINYFNNSYPKVQQGGEQIKVLEIGTNNGISLINIIKLIPNSIGYGLDKWGDYNDNDTSDVLDLESSFYKNIAVEGLEERIKGIKGDSSEILFDFAMNREIFDFIYINSSHLSFDCYSELFQSWKILNRGGLLAIDNYLYNEGVIVDSPFEGINNFLKKHKHEIKILHNERRVFLIKI